jgi:serine/threonine protein kinase
VVVEDGVVYMATEPVDALAAAHAAGLPHLDLRPACVLITADGRARLAGVGLATLRTAPGADPPTTAFLAPEQVRGDAAGPSADLWSLGAILFLAVEGEASFTGDGSDRTRAAILTERPSPQRSLMSFAVAVVVSGDPLGLRSQAVASTVATVAPATLAPTTSEPATTVSPTTQAAAVPPGWAVHTDPGAGYQVAVPPGWQVASDGGPRTELRDRSSPTFLRIDW